MGEVNKEVIGWEHLTCRPEVFAEFRKLRNARSDTRSDNAFIKLLLKVYLKWKGSKKNE